MWAETASGQLLQQQPQRPTQLARTGELLALWRRVGGHGRRCRPLLRMAGKANEGARQEKSQVEKLSASHDPKLVPCPLHFGNVGSALSGAESCGKSKRPACPGEAAPCRTAR